jgi:hypothetical protein
MRHKLAATNINGTEKMIVGDGDVIYEYVFKKQLSGTGTPSTPNYTYPIGIKLLGKDFTIVGVDSDSILMLVGSVCSGVTATNPCVYEDYSVYATLGGSSFVQVKILDKNGNVVNQDTISGWSSGTSVTKTIGTLDVTVTSIAALQDGTVVGVDMVVGPTGTTTHDYDGTADVESTVASSNDAFPGAARWGIQFSAGSSSNGVIASGAKIQVVYKPETTEYYVAGQKVSLPNNYGDLGFEGFNTNDFAVITIKPYGPASVYNATDKALQETYLYGLEISSDKAGVIYGGSDYYSRAYLLFNASASANNYPVVVGWYDSVSGKILVADGWRTASSGGSAGNGAVSTSTQYGYARLNITNNYNNFTYAFVLNNGEKNFYINATVSNPANGTVLVMHAGSSATSTSIDLGFINATSWDRSGAKFEEHFIKLGATANSAETTELNVTTEADTGDNRNAGKVSQDVVDDSGLIVLSPVSYGGSDTVKFKVPSKALAAKVYFGKLGAAAAGQTYEKYVPVTVPVAKLDTELTDADKAKNLVVVGGPCVNKEAANALGLTYPACGAASTIPENAALIKVVKDYPATGKYTVVVAGWEAANTRTACSVIQQYATLLKGQPAAVKVTAATAAGITPL